MKQKNPFDSMFQFLFLFHTGRFKKMVDKFISVLLDAADGNPKILMVKINGVYAQ